MKNKCCDCCYPQVVNSEACGCCEGISISTPLSTVNRPGLSQLAYRIGTHASFLETMIARLSSQDYSALKGLSTRDRNDPSIALLDSWSIVADVLTFYQERIANEGYLRTATERRSVLEMAKLVGYKLRPGVASSVFLAYTIDDNTKEEVTIPTGSRVQNIPAPDELPQSFETSEELKARSQWNNLKPRMTQPQKVESIITGTPEGIIKGPRVYLKGINTNLKINDPLLIEFGNPSARPTFGRVEKIEPHPIANHTLVTLRFLDSVAEGSVTSEESGGDSSALNMDNFQLSLIKDLSRPSSHQPRNSLRLDRKLKDQFGEKNWEGYRTVSSFAPQLGETLVIAAANAKIASERKIKVSALKIKGSLFGHSVPRKTTIPVKGGVIGDGGDWPIIERMGTGSTDDVAAPAPIEAHEEESNIYLDVPYDTIQPGSWMVIETLETDRLTNKKTFVVKVKSVDVSQNRAKYGVSAPTTKIEIDFLDGPDTKWIKITENLNVVSDTMKGDDFHVLRSTKVYLQPEELELSEEPIEKLVCGGTEEPIELDGFYEGLESGRWVIISGEREIEGTSGVRFSELAMLASVTQDIQRDSQEIGGEKSEATLPGDKIHTFITLAEKLAYCFKRDTVKIYGNVVKATHGETRHEILGSGDGSKALQSFELKQFPLTHVSASNPTGVDSTLEVFVNDIKWYETDSLAGLEPNVRRFITKTDDENKTKITFGNGKEGARLPTGIENVRALYRNGIGSSGNVKAEQISLLVSKPLGVKDVINPLRASGGANRENRDQARKNAPLAVKALDRLVSVQDYEDFSRVYAGIGKAHAVELSDGRRQLVHVTIAGAENIPIDETSDLFRNLRQSLHDFGDPHQPIQLAIRELMFMVISARVSILADYLWEPIATDLRKKLLDAFSFEHRELGQDVVLSEIISVMQAVRGVAYVDIEAFGGIPEKKPLAKDEIEIFDRTQIKLPSDRRRLLTPDEIVLEVSDVIKRIDQHVDEDAKKTLRKKKGNLPIPQRLIVNLASVQNKSIRPAQLAFLSPDVPDTLILNQIT